MNTSLWPTWLSGINGNELDRSLPGFRVPLDWCRETRHLSNAPAPLERAEAL